MRTCSFFRDKIEPMLRRECYACHSQQTGAKIEAGLRLDASGTLDSGGDSGPAIDRQQPKQSLILQAIKHAGGLAMPPERERLSDEVIADFEQWLQLGAPDPRPPAEELPTAIDQSKARRHYAFQPLNDALPPSVVAQSDVYQPIDAFLLAKLESHGLGFAPLASRRTWLRRITLDVTGLPPSTESLNEFESVTIGPMLMSAWSTACSPHHSTVRAGRSIGSTWCVMRKAKAMNMIDICLTPGDIAIT